MNTGKQIEDFNMEDLKQLLLAGRRATQYAWDHYEELAARESACTLYGPYDYGIGAAIPGKSIPISSRTLTLKTRKKKYLIYELDSEYRLLRVTQVFNSVNDVTYHCFELEGIQYACPFAYNQKRKRRGGEVIALAYKDGKPYFYGNLTENKVLVDFYEYVSPERVRVIGYSYNPVSIYSLHGYLIDPEAPLGELNSPAQRSCWEEKPMYTDFSQFFRDPEAVERKEEKVTNNSVSDWIDNVLNSDIPDNIAAFCFNLYEEGNGSWSMELVGANGFDLESEDWPCDEVTDFKSRENPYKWEENCSWEEALAHIVKVLKKYLANGKHAELLKSRTGVGVEFVDGNIEILYSIRRGRTGDGSLS